MAVLATVAPPLSGVLLLGTLNHVGPWLRAHQEWGALLYVAGFAVFGGLALLPTHAPSVLAGWAFGVAAGVPLALGGFLGASLLGYALARRISGDRLAALLAQHSTWSAVYDALVRSGFWKGVLIVFLLRLPPNSPFAASNLAMAGLRVPFVPYGLGTLLGLAPKTSAMVVAGAGLSVLDLSNRTQTGWFAAGLALTFVALGTLGVLSRAALRRVEREAAEQPPAPGSRAS